MRSRDASQSPGCTTVWISCNMIILKVGGGFKYCSLGSTGTMEAERARQPVEASGATGPVEANGIAQRCDSCLRASHNLSHLKSFIMSQGSLNCHSIFGAFFMFKSHQLCFCHICETQYLSVITMNSIILQFVKKGTTT